MLTLDVRAIADNQVRWEDSLGGLAALQTKAVTFDICFRFR